MVSGRLCDTHLPCVEGEFEAVQASVAWAASVTLNHRCFLFSRTDHAQFGVCISFSDFQCNMLFSIASNLIASPKLPSTLQHTTIMY